MIAAGRYVLDRLEGEASKAALAVLVFEALAGESRRSQKDISEATAFVSRVDVVCDET